MDAKLDGLVSTSYDIDYERYIAEYKRLMNTVIRLQDTL